MLTVVYATMAADLFHRGHLEFLKKARSMGDKLIIGLHSDAFIKEYKGKSPVIPFEDRKEILEACRYVDEVYLADTWEVPILVHLVVHGDGWVPPYERDPDQTLLVIPRYEGVSSTQIKEQIYDNCKCG